MVAIGLVAALPAGARGPTFVIQDTVGDVVGAAADIQTLSVFNEDDGTLTFTLAFANRPALTEDDIVGIFLNTDNNAATGSAGADYALLMSGSAQTLIRWNGTTFDVAPAASLGRPNGLALSIKPSDLGGTKQFTVAALSLIQSDENAFDETGEAPYTLYVPPKFAGTTFTVTPARTTLLVGTRVAAKVTVRLDDGTTVKPTSVSCRMTLAGKTVRPVAPCAWKLPKAAKGKRVVVSARGAWRGTAFTTRTVTIRVR